MQAHLPGVMHSRKIGAGNHVIYELDLTKMRDRAVVMLTSEHPNVTAGVYFKRDGLSKRPTQKLDQNNFAYEISNKHNTFKIKHCKSKSCLLFVVVHNTGKDPEKFSMVYTYDF